MIDEGRASHSKTQFLENGPIQVEQHETYLRQYTNVDCDLEIGRTLIFLVIGME